MFAFAEKFNEFGSISYRAPGLNASDLLLFDKFIEPPLIYT
jgi:hypothetical protein